MLTLGIVIALVFIVAFIWVSFLLYKRNNSSANSVEKKPLLQCSIYELKQRIATEEVDSDMLLKVIDYVALHHPFASDKKEAEIYLAFVYEFCLNKHSTAQVIAKMNKELNKANPTYIQSIEMYTKVAIEKRSKGTK